MQQDGGGIIIARESIPTDEDQRIYRPPWQADLDRADTRWRFAQQRAAEVEASIERLRSIAARSIPPWLNAQPEPTAPPWPSIWIRRDQPDVPSQAEEEQTASGLTIVRDGLVVPSTWPRTSPYSLPEAFVHARADVLLMHCLTTDRNPAILSNADAAEILNYADAHSMEVAFNQKGIKAREIKLEAYYRWRLARENS